VSEKPQENEDRKDRDRERSDEAHWQVAEEAAEEWDDEPKQKTSKGLEIPIPKRKDVMDALRKLVQPAKKA
jgi:hypothetical protein